MPRVKGESPLMAKHFGSRSYITREQLNRKRKLEKKNRKAGRNGKKLG